MTGQCNEIILGEESTYLFVKEEVKQKILIGRCIVSPISTKVPVKILNSRDAPTKLKKGLILTELQ
jgi:hypothetical protein